MKDKEGNKFFTDKEKCSLMELTWRDVFKITPLAYINVNENRVKSFATANMNRLNTDNYHSRVTGNS